MKKIIISVVILASLMPAICNASESNTITVGRLTKPEQGGIVLAVKRTSDSSEMIMYAYDQHNINKVFLRLSTEELLKLRDLLDATMVEYKKTPIDASTK